MEPLDDQAVGTQDLTPLAKNALLGARPWMLFLTILGFIYVAFSAIGIVTSFAAGEIGSAVSSIVTTAIMAYLYWLLFRSAQGIKQFGLDGSATTLEDTLQHYKNYWLITGIFMVIILVIMAFGVIAGIFASASGM